ncbi:MAG: AI-2E family transporter [Flammeovirgaceae bacterium]|nr:AI-2E family transporter [Flammeovirgaceae bacterium]
MGKSLNLSPLVVVITLSLWGYLWGILGMVISVPITSIMLIVLAQFPSTRNISIYFLKMARLMIWLLRICP